MTSTVGWSPSFCRNICRAIRRSSPRTCRAPAVLRRRNILPTWRRRTALCSPAWRKPLLSTARSADRARPMRRISITSAALPPISTSAWRARPPVSSRSPMFAPNNIPWAPRGAARPPTSMRRRSTPTAAPSSRSCSATRARAKSCSPWSAAKSTSTALTGFPACWSRIRTGSKAARRCSYQAALKRSPLLPNVPTLAELASFRRGQGDPARHRLDGGNRPLDHQRARRAARSGWRRCARPLREW